MDVTFRDAEPFYGEKTDLSALFEDLDPPKSIGDGQEGESASNAEGEEQERMPIVVSIPAAVEKTENNQKWPRPNEENNPQVYTRKRFVEEHAPGEHGDGNQIPGEQGDGNQIPGEQGEGN
jgi:hypothetical protein